LLPSRLKTLTGCCGVALPVQALCCLGVAAGARQHLHIKQLDRGFDEAAMGKNLVEWSAAWLRLAYRRIFPSPVLGG